MKLIYLPIIFIGLLLTGCGQKGDLYMPSQNTPTTSTQHNA
ncbi:LPS translocon maturation chaperone LptM [Piscirickettsia litoralis]|nr:lipoprotein [Piscirickettsia litoralis]